MSSFLFSKPDNAHILIVDDEPDVHAVTRLGLKGLRHEGSRLKFLSAESGAEGIEILRARPDIAVVLLDVVMESDHAGLEACRLIRQELNNHFVRILLRVVGDDPGRHDQRVSVETRGGG